MFDRIESEKWREIAFQDQLNCARLLALLTQITRWLLCFSFPLLLAVLPVSEVKCQTIRLPVVTVVFPTNLVLDVAMIIRGLVVGIAGSLVSCVAVIRGCQAVATATVGTGLVVAVRIIATLLIVVVW